MQTINIPALQRDVSAVGFGCASFGSRVSGAEGINAVAAALAHGINWFDIAPPYGDGQAEKWLGTALKGSRHNAVICSKVGIARPQISIAKKLIRPLARKVISLAPALRSVARRARSTGARNSIRPSDIELSVAESLRLLQTDYLDVLALHEPPVSEVENADIQEALARLVQKGMVRTLSVAGDSEAVAAATQQAQFDFVQFPDSPFDSLAPTTRALTSCERHLIFVTHGVFGSGLMARFESLDTTTLERVKRVAIQFGLVDATGNMSISKLLLSFALANNQDGVVITSMFNVTHVKSNSEVASVPINPELAPSLRAALRGGKWTA